MKEEVNLQELSFEALQGGMLKADFEKTIKKNATWRNKKGLVMLFNYKLANKGAKRAVVIPFKKINDAKKLFRKTIKKDPNIQLKNVLVGFMDLDKEEDGRTVVKIQQVMGNASPDLVEKQGNELFRIIGFELQLLSKAEGKVEKIKKDDQNDEEALEAAPLNERYNTIVALLKGKIGLYQLLELEQLAETFEQEIKAYKKANPEEEVTRWIALLKKAKTLLVQQEGKLNQLKSNVSKINQQIGALNQLLEQAGYRPMPLATINNQQDMTL